MENIQKLANDERNAYFREWRKKNKERVKKHNADYWKRRAERKLEQQDDK